MKTGTLRFWQCSLRKFLLVCALVAVAVGCWFRPFVVETHRPDGSLRTRFTVQRDWRGRLIACGEQQWFLPDGTCFTRTAYGESLDRDEFAELLARTADFDNLIWLITETIVPESWFERESPALSIKIGSGQTIEPQESDPTVPAVGTFP